MTRERYYYYRDARRRPLITLCRLQDATGRLGYGWAICAAHDRPVKQIGKQLARQRAAWALQGAYTVYDPLAAVYPWGRMIDRAEALEQLSACQAFEVLHNFSWYGHWEQLPPSMRPDTVEAQP